MNPSIKYTGRFADIQAFFDEYEYRPVISAIPPVKYNDSDQSCEVHQIDGRIVKMQPGQYLEITSDDSGNSGLWVTE
jgi:hypothetical protein